VGRAVGDDPSVQDEGKPIALLRLVHVVRGDEDRHPAVGRELVDQVPEEPPPLRVHAPGRLVEKEQLGLVQERRRERDALALAGRQARGHRGQERREAQSLRELADPAFEPGDAKAVEGAEEAQVLADGQVDVERELLAHVSEPGLPLLGVPRHVEPAEAGR
jgi:hypothetical protein